jgi:TM2 domain-containing membrane protein YozV/DNA-directed RNA polymerase subunit RPC12/RpoP
VIIKCPICGEHLELPDGETIEDGQRVLCPFCNEKFYYNSRSCNQRIEEEDIAPITVTLSSDKLFCTKCGAHIDKSAVVCPSCGCAVGPKKSHFAYIVLGIFFGVFGAHNFYAGYIASGIIQLLITFLTGGIGAIAAFIWAFIEICTVTTDAKGRPFK